MICEFKIFLGVFFSYILIGCVSNDSSAIKNGMVRTGDTVKDGREESDSIRASSKSIEDFDRFFVRFNTDSVFQKSRIIFPLRLTIVGEDEQGETLIEKRDWTFTNLSDKEDIKGKIKKTVLNKERVKIEYSIEDTGVLVDHLFCVNNGVWWLCSITDQSD